MKEFKNSDPRDAALYALIRIDAGAFSNIIITDVLGKGSFSPEDRALFTNIVRGVTERRITLDYVIDSLSSMPPSKIDADARNILRIGIYQLLYMKGIPHHAAVNESVKLTRQRSRGFVNAILRSFIRQGCAITLPDEKIKRMSVEFSASEELCSRFTEIFGEERARAIFSGIFGQKMCIAVNTLKVERDALCEKIRALGYEAECGRLSPRAIKTNAPYSLLSESFPGEFFAMDEASQSAGEVLSADKGERIIDVCSAPGSKSFYSAIRMENEGEILSFDLHKSKISLIESGADRLGIDIIKAGDADGSVNIPEYNGAFDAVLCDVPCSGLGVIGTKPEIKYKSLSDFGRLPEIQRRILLNASRYVRNGGRLVYSTCTLLPEENEENVRTFLKENGDFSLDGFTLGDRIYDGMLTLTPETGETDGFFIARLRKKESV